MSRLRLLALAAIFAALFCVHTASAQIVSSLAIVSGNGQLCCTINNSFSFQSMTVRATDASGNPVANATITWTVVSSGTLAGFGFLDFGATTVTAADGTSSNLFFQTGVPQTGTLAQPYLLNQIQAAANTGSPSVTFVGATALSDINSTKMLTPQAPTYNGQDLSGATPISGQSGTQGSAPIQLFVGGAGVASTGVPGISMRLVNNQTSPTITCATGANADPGAVLTNANGLASCTPIFGGVGSGSYSVIVGGVASSDLTQEPAGFGIFGPYSLGPVTPAAPGLIQVVSGNGQTGNPGQFLPLQLVAKVTDAAGVSTIPNAQVTWTVIPTGAATLSNTRTTSDANGQVSTSVALSGSAAGTVQITVALANNATISTTFAVSVAVQLGPLQKLSGDGQSAAQNTAFTQPLVVQVNNANGLPVGNYPVLFAVTSGSASVSSASVLTGANGRAQVNVTAGSVVGSVAVTATAGASTQTFHLTVSPPAPFLSANSFYNGASFQTGFISPCSIATIIAPGIAPNLQGVVVSDLSSFGFGLLPYTLAGVSVSFSGSQAPIYNVANMNGQQQVSVQVPCDVAPAGSVAVVVGVNGANASVNVPVLNVSPGIFQTTMEDGVVRAVIVRADGSFMSTRNPARLGEIVRAYVTGLGQTDPAITTNAISNPGADLLGKGAFVLGKVIAGITNSAGQGEGALVTGARYAPDLIGVYEVAFQIPFDAATGNNVTFSMSIIPAGSTVVSNSLGSKIIVQ